MTPSPINDLILTIKSRRRKRKAQLKGSQQGLGGRRGVAFIGRDPEEADWTVAVHI